MKNLLSLLFVFMTIIPTQAAEKAELQRRPTVNLTTFSPTVPFFDTDGYVQMQGYRFIEPDFIKAVLTLPSPNKDPSTHNVKRGEVLEICAGQGFTLENTLKAQSSKSPSINYTAVELSPLNMQALNERFLKNNTEKATKLKYSQQDIVKFLTTNLEGKKNKFDLVFGGFALHVLSASSYVATLGGLFDVMKEDGKLFLTQHSTLDGEYSDEYLNKVKQGVLIPFWSGKQFYSDPETMTKMLNVFGFEIDTIGLYAEIHSNKTISRYLGLIARKKSALRNADKVKEYAQAANSLITIKISSDVLPKKDPVKSSPSVQLSRRIVEKDKVSKIPNYETYLKCTASEDSKHSTQNDFTIHQNDGQKIGEILLQYYPTGGHYKTGGRTPIIRLRHIEIEEQFRRNHSATRALETLFTELRKSAALPQNVEVWLEYSSSYKFLAPWYQSFGFQHTEEPSAFETKVMRVLLSKTQFPYYKKIKESQKVKK